MPFTASHDHFTNGLSFEEAKQAAGYSACSCAVSLLLARYWNLLEMERAVDLAASYFDRMEAMT
jgi:hypothetical protein